MFDLEERDLHFFHWCIEDRYGWFINFSHALTCLWRWPREWEAQALSIVDDMNGKKWNFRWRNLIPIYSGDGLLINEDRYDLFFDFSHALTCLWRWSGEWKAQAWSIVDDANGRSEISIEEIWPPFIPMMNCSLTKTGMICLSIYTCSNMPLEMTKRVGSSGVECYGWYKWKKVKFSIQEIWPPFISVVSHSLTKTDMICLSIYTCSNMPLEMTKRVESSGVECYGWYEWKKWNFHWRNLTPILFRWWTTHKQRPIWFVYRFPHALTCLWRWSREWAAQMWSIVDAMDGRSEISNEEIWPPFIPMVDHS